MNTAELRGVPQKIFITLCMGVMLMGLIPKALEKLHIIKKPNNVYNTTVERNILGRHFIQSLQMGVHFRFLKQVAWHTKYYTLGNEWLNLDYIVDKQTGIILKKSYTSNNWASVIEALYKKTHIPTVFFSLPYKNLMHREERDKEIEGVKKQLAPYKDIVVVAVHLPYKNMEDYYLKTDQHWNFNGWYEGYRQLVEFLNTNTDIKLKPYKKRDFTENKTAYNTGFGTEYEHIVLSKYVKEDTICRMELPFLHERYANRPVITSHLYDGYLYDEYPNIKGLKASVYKPASNNNGKTVMIFRDSYMRPLKPFLYEQFKHVYDVELRFQSPNYQIFDYDEVEGQKREQDIPQILPFIKTHHIDTILFLNSMYNTGENHTIEKELGIYNAPAEGIK